MSLPNSNSFDNLGGELEDLYPVADPQTDLSAEASNDTRADLAMMSRTAYRAIVQFTAAASPSLVGWDAVWKGSDSTAPEITRSSQGHYLITFAETVINERGLEVGLNFQFAHASVMGGSIYHAQCDEPDPNSVALVIGTSGETLTDPSADVVVWIV